MALLAEALGVPEADVELTSGQSSRSKRFRLKGLDAEEGEKRLRVALDRPTRPTAARAGPVSDRFFGGPPLPAVNEPVARPTLVKFPV